MPDLLTLGLIGGGLYALTRLKGAPGPTSSTLSSQVAAGNAAAGAATLDTSRSSFPSGPLSDLVQHVLDSLADPASKSTLLAEARGTPISEAAHNLAIADLLANQEPFAWPLAQVTSAISPATAQAILTLPGAQVESGLGSTKMAEVLSCDAVIRACIDLVRQDLGMDPIDWISLDGMASSSSDPAIVAAVAQRDPLAQTRMALATQHSQAVLDTADMLEVWATDGTDNPAYQAVALDAVQAIRDADQLFWNQVDRDAQELQAAGSAGGRDTAVLTSFATGERRFFSGSADDSLAAAPAEETGLVDTTGVSDIQAPESPFPGNVIYEPTAEALELASSTEAIAREGRTSDPTVIDVDVFDPLGDEEGRGSKQTMQWPPYPAAPPDGLHWELRPGIDSWQDTTGKRHALEMEMSDGIWTLVRNGYTAPGAD